MVGPGHAVDLAPGQGYNASEEFRCEVEPTSHELGAFFGAWRIDPGACKPLDCVDYPRPIPNAYPPSQDECLRNMSLPGYAFRVRHGEKCKITCNPGYEPQGTRDYECDRGIFLEPLCVKRKCAVPPLSNGVYSPEIVTFGSKLTAVCDDGYEPSTVPVRCSLEGNAPEAPVAFLNPEITVPICDPRQCVTANPDYSFGSDPKASFNCTQPAVFGQICHVMCAYGFAVGSTSEASIVCDDTSPQRFVKFSAASTCDPLTCNADLTYEKMLPGDCVDGMAIGDNCTRSCENGYALGGIRSLIGASIPFQCIDDKKVGRLQMRSDHESCEPVPCALAPQDIPATIPLSVTTLPGGRSVCDSAKPMKSGDSCLAVCAAVGSKVADEATMLTCYQGTYFGCRTGECDNPSSLLSPPTCISMTSTVVKRDVIYGSIALRLNPPEPPEDTNAAGRAVARSLHIHLELQDKDVVEITELAVGGRRLRALLERPGRALQAPGVLSAHFYVDCQGTLSKLDAVQLKLTALSNGEGLEEFLETLNTVFQQTMPGVEVEHVQVAAPYRASRSFEVKGYPPPKEDQSSLDPLFFFVGGAFLLIAIIMGVSLSRYRKSAKVQDEVPY